MPSFKLPKFGFKGKGPKGEMDAELPDTEIETPDLDIDGKLPTVDLDASLPSAEVKGPDLEISAEAPTLDIDIEKPSGKFDLNMPDIHLPKFGFKGKKPKADLDLGAPDLNLGAPNLDAKVDGPSVDID